MRSLNLVTPAVEGSQGGFKAPNLLVIVVLFGFSLAAVHGRERVTLAALSNQTVNVGQTAAATASATDPNSPPPVLTFTLLNAPTNASLVKIGSTNAAFNWRPQVGNADTTNLVKLKVADNASPSLSATQSFLVAVNPLITPSIAASAWSSGQFSLSVSGQSGPDYAVQGSTNLADWSTLWVTNSPPVPFSWVDATASNYPMHFYRLLVGPPLP